MTTKYLHGHYPGGYYLSPSYTGLDVEATARVGGAGVYARFFTTIQNDGVINATTAQKSGIYLRAGGIVTNGSAIDTAALIEGSDGVFFAGVATIANFGTIEGGGSLPNMRSGVSLGQGGAITNGSAADTTALIEGFYGVSAANQPATIANFGTIKGQETILVGDGGTFVNGSAADTTALVYGGVFFNCANGSTITNFGTILGEVQLNGFSMGGDFTNGSAVDTRALVKTAGSAVETGIFAPARSTITNYGTLWSTQTDAVSLGGFYGESASCTNGSATDTTALIKGFKDGVNVGGLLNDVTNFGTIEGSGSTDVRQGGISLYGGGTVTNGSAADATALISGPRGVYALIGYAPVTITNYGVITGTGGAAVQLGSAADVLRVEAGCGFNGAVLGGGGTIDLASGVGTVSNLSGGYVTVSGSMATTTFTNFGTLEIAGGAKFKLTGTGTIGSGGTTSLIDNGTLVVAGAITGTGTLAVGSGTLTLGAGASVSIATATFGAGAVVNGAGTVTLTNATVAGLSVGEAVTVIDAGTVDQTGTILLRRFPSSPRLTIEAGAIWRLDGDVGMARRGSLGPVVTVDGTLIKSAGTGVSAVGVNVTDDGAVEAATGTLDFMAGVTGSGAMQVDAGATLEFNKAVANTLTATLAGAGATLALSQASTFAATIAGFAAGQTLDLLKTAADSAVLKGGDQLVITNGTSAVATLQLSGDYTGDTFTTSSDGNGGTSITVGTGGAVAPLAAGPVPAPHAFIAAAAAFGAAGGAVHATALVHQSAARLTLSAPRSMVA
jgi:hypothetical protein